MRNRAGLFDVSHMGEISIKGADAEQFIQHLVTNDISKAKEYQAVYSPMCYPNGGVVDDLLIYKYNREHYLLVVNASNTDKDYEWILNNKSGNVIIENISASLAQLALQGPKAQAILQKLTDYPLDAIKFFCFAPEVIIDDEKAIVSRSGYTGEDGFEIYIASDKVATLWDKLLEVGKEDGLVPVGLGARDTLRFEAALPLYGNEFSAEITPLEAGLGKFVKLDKVDFIGKEALVMQKEQGIKRKLVGIELIDGGMPRSHYDVVKDGKNIGFLTSGSFNHATKKGVAMALIASEYATEGNELEVVIRNKNIKAKIVSLPFYTKKYKK